MRWEDERYVRLYTRDTPEWCALPWEARALFSELLRKVDRAGVMPLGRSGVRGLAGLVRMPLEVVETALRDLLDDGCVIQNQEGLFLPNFLAAQEANQSDRARKAASREKAAAVSRQVTLFGMSRDVTDSHESGPTVTIGHAPSQPVTAGHPVPGRAVPNRTVPCRPAADDGDVGSVIERALRAHRKLVGMDLPSIARDLVEGLDAARIADPHKVKPAEALVRDIGDAVAQLPEMPNEATARGKLRSFVVNGGWNTPSRAGGRRGRQVQGGVDELPAHQAASAAWQAEQDAEDARRRDAGEEDEVV
jgi:hypothetical protein